MQTRIEPDAFAQHSAHEAMHACARLFAASDTKWFDLILPTAIQQLLDDCLLLSLHLRRLSEFSGKKIRREIVNMALGIERDFSAHETNLWRCINRLIHHTRLEPVIFTQDDFYKSGSLPMSGHLVADLRVESDQGWSTINLAGFAIACSNELGEQLLSKSEETKH